MWKHTTIIIAVINEAQSSHVPLGKDVNNKKNKDNVFTNNFISEALYIYTGIQVMQHCTRQNSLYLPWLGDILENLWTQGRHVELTYFQAVPCTFFSANNRGVKIKFIMQYHKGFVTTLSRFCTIMNNELEAANRVLNSTSKGGMAKHTSKVSEWKLANNCYSWLSKTGKMAARADPNEIGHSE